MTGDIKVVDGDDDDDDDNNVAFKNCHPFNWAIIELNNEHVENAENSDLTMNLYNIINYSNNYADTTTSSYYYKRPDQTRDDNGNISSINNNLTSFKYQSDLIKKQVNSVNVAQNIDPDIANAHTVWKNAKKAVPLKYISNFLRTLELPLINTKLYIELNWTKHSVISTVDTATIFK